MSGAYYNEFDPFAAEWLRNLILWGHIAPGDVDERDLWDVHPDDLRGYDQHHFCAGIGVWSYALRRRGWDDRRPIWTASLPCQPFSAAGKGLGFLDERHLLPAFLHLVRECRPDVLVGEQVASKPGLMWLDALHSDLEGEGYAVGAVDLCAAGVGAPHIRQRLWWMAQPQGQQHDGPGDARRGRGEPTDHRAVRGVAHADPAERRAVEPSWDLPDGDEAGWVESDGDAEERGGAVVLGDASYEGLPKREREALLGAGRGEEGRAAEQSSRSRWADAEWIDCQDGKRRPVEPGVAPLAHGASNRVGRLRGYGNAICAPLAEAFLEVVMDLVE